MSNSDRSSIDIVVRWGDTVLRTEELSPPRAWFVGDGSVSENPVDFVLPEGTCHEARVSLVEVSGDEAVVVVPRGAYAERRGTGSFGASRCTEGRLSVTDGAVDVHVGALVFSVRRGTQELRIARAPFVPDRRGAASFAAAFVACAAFVGGMAYFTPPLGLTDDEDNHQDRLIQMQAYLDASAEREIRREIMDGPKDDESGGAKANAPREPARGQSGAMGTPRAVARNQRASGATDTSETRPATSRSEQLREMERSTILGLLNSAIAAPTVAPWEDPGAGQMLAAGGFFGDTIGDSVGIGGLDLTGPGDGGGGRSDQIGIGMIGTCFGTVCGQGLAGAKDGIGVGGSRTGPGHVAVAPKMTMQPPITSGTLPAEVIQRVVRQSFGRFRGCYEDGLRGNPTLEGRVTARFVIGRDGSVATVQSGGTDLPDSRVVACVMRTYQGLSFPAPKDGIVTVSYPLVFSPAT